MIGIIELGLLWFAHCIGDMTLQSNFIANFKSKFWYAMFTHTFVWAATISLVLSYLGIFSLWKFVFLMLGHWLIDRWKTGQPKDEAHQWCIYADQVLHFVQILFVGLLP